jgi:hypothetical protein
MELITDITASFHQPGYHGEQGLRLTLTQLRTERVGLHRRRGGQRFRGEKPGAVEDVLGRHVQDARYLSSQTGTGWARRLAPLAMAVHDALTRRAISSNDHARALDSPFSHPPKSSASGYHNTGFGQIRKCLTASRLTGRLADSTIDVGMCVGSIGETGQSRPSRIRRSRSEGRVPVVSYE